MSKLVAMSQSEIKKYDIIKKLINKEFNGSEAARLLSLTVRQIRRLKKLVIEKGAKGLVHGNRGKSGNRSIPEEERERIVILLHKHYSDFGPTFAAEKLAECHKIKRDKGTIRAIQTAEGSNACFATSSVQTCGQMNCLWRLDCK